MERVRTVTSLREAVARWRAGGETVALVPTMGALHQGHMALVKAARETATRTVVSIFVNPTQFAPNEDFERYPRDETGDLKALEGGGADLVFTPSGKDMYPDGFATAISVEGPAKAGLEDKYRPHFFGGVATVVCKLLTQALPDHALFGEKDYQQLLVIKRMARDLDLPVSIEGVATVRERDGLALSSRNAYLTHNERSVAHCLHDTLKDTARRLAEGGDPAKLTAAAAKSLTRVGFRVDYVEARNAGTLAKLKNPAKEPVRLLAAAWLGKTRLIDNIACL